MPNQFADLKSFHLSSQYGLESRREWRLGAGSRHSLEISSDFLVQSQLIDSIFIT